MEFDTDDQVLSIHRVAHATKNIKIFFPERFAFLGVRVEYNVCPCPVYVLSGLCPVRVVSVWVMSVSGLCPRVKSVSGLCLCPGYVPSGLCLSGLCLSMLCPSTRNMSLFIKHISLHDVLIIQNVCQLKQVLVQYVLCSLTAEIHSVAGTHPQQVVEGGQQV